MIEHDSGVVAHMMRDLHDGPLQDVFATRLRLDSLAHRVPPELADEIRQLSLLQSRIIRRMRQVGRGGLFNDGRSFRDVLDDTVADAALALGFEPVCLIDPAVDLIDQSGVASDVIHAVRESLSNIARHANATLVMLSITIDSIGIRLMVRDNGSGIPVNGHRGNGLANLRTRATNHGGSCVFRPNESVGTVVDWWVPFGVSGTGTPPGRDRASFASSRPIAMA